MNRLARLSMTVLLGALCCVSLFACKSGESPSVESDRSTETMAATSPMTDLDTVVTEAPASGTETPAGTETEALGSETLPESETIDYSAYSPHYDYTYLYNTTAPGSPTEINGKRTVGTRITVEEDCFLSTLTFTCPSWGDRIGELQVIFYRWDTDRSTTIAAEPVFAHTVTDTPDNSSVTIHLPAHTIGAGEWYYEFCNGSSNAIGVLIHTGKTDASDGAIRTVEGYVNGRVTERFAQCYATYVRYEAGIEQPKPLDPAAYTQLTEGKAHVIILTGQSNAAGQSLLSYLKDTVSAEDYALYEKGFDNILIDVHADNGDAACMATNGFVPVKLGQGSVSDRFGIEVGLAAYLSQAYPGETFYIIKSGFSASGLAKHWQSGQSCHELFNQNMQISLDRLTNMGLDPEIFAFLWMQGETDAGYIEDTDRYGELTEDLIRRMSDRYAEHISPGGFAYIDAAISDRACWPYATIVNMHKAQCAARSQNRYFLDTNTPDIDCRDENDDIAHYDSDDMIELGTLFGEAVGMVIENAKKAA